MIRAPKGVDFVYPGHAVTLALAIVETYPSYAAANARSGDFPSALTNHAIPGAGGNVYGALALLHRICVDGTPIDEAFRIADENWSHCDDQKILRPTHWKTGQDQADGLKDRLREHLKTFR